MEKNYFEKKSEKNFEHFFFENLWPKKSYQKISTKKFSTKKIQQKNGEIFDTTDQRISQKVILVFL